MTRDAARVTGPLGRQDGLYACLEKFEVESTRRSGWLLSQQRNYDRHQNSRHRPVSSLVISIVISIYFAKSSVTWCNRGTACHLPGNRTILFDDVCLRTVC